MGNRGQSENHHFLLKTAGYGVSQIALFNLSSFVFGKAPTHAMSWVHQPPLLKGLG